MPPSTLILGIETSCDETAAAVVEGGRFIRSNVVASQHELHAEYRGVVPEIASRAHAERILPIVRAAASEAGVSLADMSAVAVSNRPGLIGSLLVGVSAAKALAWSLGVPLVAVDHVHAHLYAGLLAPQAALGSSDSASAAPVFAPPRLPALGLVVSGGHTSLYHVASFTSLTRLGGTIDDAAGEAYDKVAAILGLPFPGGPEVDALARAGNDRAIDLPISRLGKDSLDFSFSGLKTAVLYAVRGVPGQPPPAASPAAADVAASFQRAAVAALLLKLARAADAHPHVRTLLIGGGVSANSRLRSELAAFAKARGFDLRLPAMSVCVDNAAMIAGLGYHLLEARGWTSDPLSTTAQPTTAV